MYKNRIKYALCTQNLKQCSKLRMGQWPDLLWLKLSLSAKLLEDSFVLTHKTCTVKIVGFRFFLFQLSSILPNAHFSGG